jgi:hypothetical protein
MFALSLDYPPPERPDAPCLRCGALRRRGSLFPKHGSTPSTGFSRRMQEPCHTHARTEGVVRARGGHRRGSGSRPGGHAEQPRPAAGMSCQRASPDPSAFAPEEPASAEAGALWRLRAPCDACRAVDFGWRLLPRCPTMPRADGSPRSARTAVDSPRSSHPVRRGLSCRDTARASDRASFGRAPGHVRLASCSPQRPR